MQRLTICIAEDSKVVRAAIQSLLQNSGFFDIVGVAVNGREACEQAKVSRPQVALLDVAMPELDGIEAARQIATMSPETVIIMLSSQDNIDIVRDALKAGARDYIRKPIHGPELIQKILSIYAREGTRRTSSGESGRRKILMFTSPKTGIGVTTIAANCAVAMTRKMHKKVLVVDLDFTYSDISHCLGAKRDISLADLLAKPDPHRHEVIKPHIIETPSGVSLLPGSVQPYPELAKNPAIESILRAVEQDYDFLICDLPPISGDLWLKGMELGDQVMMVVGSDVPAIRAAKVALELLRKSRLSPRKVKVIYNHLSQENPVDIKDVEEFINFPIYARICCDRESVTKAYLARTPFMLKEINNISRDIENLVEKIFTGKETV